MISAFDASTLALIYS